MTNPIKPRLRRIASSALHLDLKDIDLERQRQATASTAAFINERLSHIGGTHGADALDAKLHLLRFALDESPEAGLVLEFGVATGLTLREIAAKRLPAHGFDSFEGLPEHWRDGYEKGVFAQDLPEVGGAELHVGWFDQTLGTFLDDHPGPIAFMHVDADLYSSAVTIFTLAFDRLVPGTVIVFDEYFNYPGWEHHEHKAFTEFLQQYEGGVEYLGYNGLHEQLVVRLT